MAVTDLLQWVETARKTGVLVVDRHPVRRAVAFRDGRIVACSSNDPPTLLGQALLSRGRIDEATLREALARQERDGGNLGAILVEMGAITGDEIVRHIAVKAEETLYALFDAAEAEFRFEDGAEPPKNRIDVDLRIQDLLLKGVQRFDEMKRVREVFPSAGVVLERTGKAVPEALAGSRGAHRILEWVDGERSLAELLLHARASEYLVSKLLFELHRHGVVRVRAVLDPEVLASRVDTVGRRGASLLPPPDPERLAQAIGGPEPVDVSAEVDVAERLLHRNEIEAAIAVLRAADRLRPHDPGVRERLERAEAAFLETASVELDPSRVPVRVDGIAESALSPAEAYLVSLSDGSRDVRTMLWTAPMRAVDIFRALAALRSKGVVELRDPAR